MSGKNYKDDYLPRAGQIKGMIIICMISASCTGYIFESKKVTRTVQQYLETSLSLCKSLPIY